MNLKELLKAIENYSIDEVEKRMNEIRSMDLDACENIDELTQEVDALEKRKAELKKNADAVKELRNKILNGQVETRTIEKPREERRTMNLTKENVYSSAEYRSAFLKQLRNIQLNEIETRALTTGASSAGAVVPTQTMNKIIEKVKQYAPMLEKIDLLAINGNVTVPTEGTTIEAKLHTEGASITADEDTLNKVTLGMYEITKLVTISKSVETMSIDTFEEYLVKKIAKKVANKITGYILNGTGSSEPQGINAITWNGENSVTVAKSASLTEANLDALVGLLNGGYDNGAEWFMSKKTFFTDFRPLQDKSKNEVITKENGIWYVEGYPVSFDDRITLHEAILGNCAEGYIGNMPETATVTSQFVVRENSFDFLGSAMFDGKVSAVEAFVKLVKATA